MAVSVNVAALHNTVGPLAVTVPAGEALKDKLTVAVVPQPDALYAVTVYTPADAVVAVNTGFCDAEL